MTMWTLHSDSLFDKFGFRDGDLFWDFLDEHDVGELIDERDFLFRAVKMFLLPVVNAKLGRELLIERVVTCHNPARVHASEIGTNLPNITVRVTEAQLVTLFENMRAGKLAGAIAR